jgi:hypothetical protein
MTLVVGLAGLQPAPAEAQYICALQRCLGMYCFAENGNVRCVVYWAGCWGAYPCPGCCNCPVGGSSCIPTTDVRPEEGGEPSEETLINEGRAACQQLIRNSLRLERGVRLFDDTSSRAIVSGPGRVTVTGTAEAKEMAKTLFKCEVERDEKGVWTQEVLSLSQSAR